MKNFFLTLFIISSLNIVAQRNRAPKMEPVFAPGYYVNQRNDTIRGDIQTNAGDETEFHKQIVFRIGGKARKPRVINGQKAKAFGFDDKHFVLMVDDGKKIFLERLVSGRLRLYELKEHGKKDGYSAIVSTYFIRDTEAEQPDEKLREFRKLSTTFYKKALKPYLKDQPMLWADLDKFTFDKNTLVNSLNEFNRFYTRSGN